jgi:hypothetical protein
MTPIELEYQRFRFILRTRKLKTSHPDSWSELSPIQLLAAVRFIDGTINDDEVIIVMLNLTKRLVRRLTPYQKFCIIDLMSFLQTHTPWYDFILPTIGEFRKPQARLKDETFGTFIFAETYFDKYLKSEDKEYLAKFIACYYRTGKFLEADIRPNSESIVLEPLVKQEAIAINYTLIREWLIQEYPNVFQPAEDQTKAAQSTWLDVYDAIVGDDIVKQAEYADLPISTVLRYLDKRVKHSKHEGKI